MSRIKTFGESLLGGLGEQLFAIDINLHKLLHFHPSVLLLLLLEMGRPGHRKHGRTANRCATLLLPLKLESFLLCLLLLSLLSLSFFSLKLKKEKG